MRQKSCASPLGGRAECILCGKCLEACPLFKATGREELSPRAKFLLLGRLASGKAEFSEEEAVRLAGLCLSCGRCEGACPLGLCAPELVARKRAEHPGFAGWVWKQWLTRAGVLWPAAAAAARLTPDGLLGEAGRRAAETLRELRAASDIRPWLRAVAWDRSAVGTPLMLFSGCTARFGRRNWAKTARFIVTRLGYAIERGERRAEAFTCCGCSLGHAGLADAQQAMQRANIEAWRQAGRPLIAAFCATCRCGLRGYARQDLGWEPMEREEWLDKVRPLAALFGNTRFDVLGHAPARVIFHRPCHGRGGDFDLKWLRSALGERLDAPADNACCGFGGVMQLGAPELSAEVGAACWEGYAPRMGDTLLTGCSGCVVQLAATASEGATVGHWLDAVVIDNELDGSCGPG